MINKSSFWTQVITCLPFFVFLNVSTVTTALAQAHRVAPKVDTTLFSDFLSSTRDKEVVHVENKILFLGFLEVSKCLAGSFYFSGVGFPSVVLVEGEATSDKLKRFFERCVVGTKLTLENCAFFRDGGHPPIFISKTVVFK